MTGRPTQERLAELRRLYRESRGDVPSPHLDPFLAEIDALEADVAEARKWVNDLHSGMYVNCVYCGHRYGPKDEVPATMADALKAHIERCPKHPMSELRAMIVALERVLMAAHTDIGHWVQLAERQRKVMDQNLGWCPTQAGIDTSRKVRDGIGAALVAVRRGGGA